MPILTIENKFISLDNIQKCIEVFDRILIDRKAPIEIIIEAKQKIEGFDPLLISYFMLFKMQVPDIQIYLKLPHNEPDSDNDIGFQLIQFGTYAYLMTGTSVFQIEFNSQRIKFDLANKESFPEGWFVFSADYFPILLINEDPDLFNLIFNKSLRDLLWKPYELKINELDKKITWDKNSEQLKKNYHAFLRTSSKPKDREKSFINLARMAFINSLDEAKVAHLFFEEEYTPKEYTHKNRIQAGSLHNEAAFEYYQTIKPIFEELEDCSLVHQFIFSTILATEMLSDKASGKDVLNEDTKRFFINKIFSVWGFTKDLVSGIKELAKNVREHSSPSIGAILVRLFGLNKWIQTKNTGSSIDDLFHQYNNNLRKAGWNDKSSIIEINIIDMGNIGVIPTLIKGTEVTHAKISDRNKELKKLIEEDIENLKGKKISFYNLLDTSQRQLNQQAKRAIAHFGLLTLSKLVSHNKGLIIASSDDGFNARESVCVPKMTSNYVHPIKRGTNYNIILPINPTISYTTHLPHKISFPLETSAKDIMGIEELFNYKVLNSRTLRPDSMKDSLLKYLIEFSFDNAVLNNRDDEDHVWNRIESEVRLLKDTNSVKYGFCFDFKKVAINESQLLRFLGKCDLNYPKIPVILLNVEIECYQALLKINRDFHEQNPNLPYWNENISTLVYSYQKLEGNQFYFTDVLWGKTRMDFIYLNWMISFSNFNSNSMMYKEEMKKSLPSIPLRISPNTELFFPNNNLLPFELILNGIGNTTLFEENTLVLLKNELNS